MTDEENRLAQEFIDRAMAQADHERPPNPQRQQPDQAAYPSVIGKCFGADPPG